MPLIARRSGHLHRILHLSSLPRSFVKDILMRRLPTLGSVTNREVVPTGSRHIGTTTTSLRMGWVGAPESAANMDVAPGEWMRSLTRTQTLDDARQLQRNASLMTSNLCVLDQYALSLHGVASDMLQLIVGRHKFPSAAVNDAAPVLRVCRTFTHSEAMGLWRPPLGPGGP